MESTVAQQPAEKSREILFGPGITDHAFDLAGGDVEGGNQGLSAWRRYSNSRRSTLPGTIGSPGAMRSNA